MLYAINRYLEDNGLPQNEGFLLRDKGDGCFIAEWDVDIDKPSQDIIDFYLKEEQAKLEDAIKQKEKIKAYEAMGWVDPYALVEDILERGLDAIKQDREAIKDRFK